MKCSHPDCKQPAEWAMYGHQYGGTERKQGYNVLMARVCQGHMDQWERGEWSPNEINMHASGFNVKLTLEKETVTSNA